MVRDSRLSLLKRIGSLILFLGSFLFVVNGVKIVYVILGCHF